MNLDIYKNIYRQEILIVFTGAIIAIICTALYALSFNQFASNQNMIGDEISFKSGKYSIYELNHDAGITQHNLQLDGDISSVMIEATDIKWYEGDQNTGSTLIGKFQIVEAGLYKLTSLESDIENTSKFIIVPTYAMLRWKWLIIGYGILLFMVLLSVYNFKKKSKVQY